MCYFISTIKNKIELEMRFEVKFPEKINFAPRYRISAFDKDAKIPAILNESPDKADFYHWGLIPFWIKTEEDAENIRTKTANAKAETIFEKPSFKRSILYRRALILADGFFEWHNKNGVKIPYYIKFKDHRPFAIAGIWDEWENRKTGEVLKTVSILTYKANSLLSKIHNTKKRMPLILPDDIEKEWLKRDLREEEIKEFFKSYEYDNLIAYPVSKKLFLKGDDKDPQILKEVNLS